MIRRPKRFVTIPPSRYENGLLTTESPNPWSDEFSALFFCEDFVQLGELDLSRNSLKAIPEMILPNLRKLHISGKLSRII
jgi:hypothetical protein